MPYNDSMKGIGEHLAAIEKNIELVTNDPVARGGFTQIPNFIIRHSELSVGAKISYAALLSYAWHNDCVFPGLETLAEDIGSSVRSVKNYVKELQSFGLVEITRRGLGKTNIYRLHFTVSQKSK